MPKAAISSTSPPCSSTPYGMRCMPPARPADELVHTKSWKSWAGAAWPWSTSAGASMARSISRSPSKFSTGFTHRVTDEVRFRRSGEFWASSISLK